MMDACSALWSSYATVSSEALETSRRIMGQDASEVLCPHIEYYDRLDCGNAETSCAFLCRITDKVIRKSRPRRNAEALIIHASESVDHPALRERSPACGRGDKSSKVTAIGDKPKGEGGGQGGTRGRGKDSPSISDSCRHSGTS